MNSYREYLRWETILVALVLLAAVGVFSLFQQNNRTEKEGIDLGNRLTKTETALARLADQSNQLRSEMAELQPSPAQVPLPSRGEALGLSGVIATYVGERDILVSRFDSAQTFADKLWQFALLGESEYPAINYSLVAQGKSGELLGLLDLADNIPSGLVQDLKFEREFEVEEENSDDVAVRRFTENWFMSFSLLVVYE